MYSNNNAIGVLFNRVPASYPVAKLFTTTFRNKAGVTPQSTVELVGNIAETIAQIHGHDIVLVDNNEMNMLVPESDLSEVRFIDVDSYQTKNFPAQAIADGIRDWRSPNTFTKESDWFSFGVVACQLFIGMHPYGGGHPDFKQIKNKSERRVERCKAGVSIFDPKSTYPAAVRDFGFIPKEFRAWFERLFSGDRSAPPTVAAFTGVIISTRVDIRTSGARISLTLLKDYKEDILNVHYIGEIPVTVVETPTKFAFPSDDLTKKDVSDCIFTGARGHKFYTVSDVTGTTTEYDQYLKPSKEHPKRKGTNAVPFIKDGRFWTFNKGVVEKWNFYGSLMAVDGQSYNTMPQASTIYDGFIHQDIMRECTITIPDHTTIRLKELDGYRIIDGKCMENILMITGYKNGQYDTFLFRFAAGYNKYNKRVFEDSKYINFTVLWNGTVVRIVADGELEIFVAKYAEDNSFTVNQISDSIIRSDMQLYHKGSKVLCTIGSKLYEVGTK